MSRRTFRIGLIVLAVVLFTGYFAFSTFLFSPLEGRYPYDVSTLLPRDVDFFVSKANLAKDFDAKLEPRFLADLEQTEWGQAILRSPEWQSASRSLALEDTLEQVRAELAKLPIPVDPLELFGGRDLAVSGFLTGSDLASSRWILLGRSNWIGKLAVSALRYPGLLKLEQSGLTVKPEGQRISIAGGGLDRPLFVARLRDVVLISSDPLLLDSAFEFEAKKGQDSLGQSARYHDEIQARNDPEHDELEILARYATLAPKLGLPTGFPDKRSQNPAVAFAGQLFQLDMIRELAGVARFNRGVSFDISGDLVAEKLDGRQKKLYRGKDLEARDLSSEVARFVPNDAALFAVLEADLSSMLGMLLDSLEPALVSNLETEVVRPVFGYANLQPLLADLDFAFRDRALLIVRKNDYPTEPNDPIPNNGLPTLSWAVGLWVESPEKIQELQEKLTRQPARIGVRGPQNPDGSYGGGIFTNTVSGGLRIYEYWSPIVPGTGHIASMLDSKVFFVSNHWLLLDRIARTLYDSKSQYPSLADNPVFAGLVNTALPAETFAIYAQPAQAGDDMRKILTRQAEDEMNGLIDWDLEGPRIRKQVLAKNFPGETYGQLAPEIQAQLEMLATPELDAFRAEFRQKNLPVLLARYESQWAALESFESFLLALRLEPKDFQIALRALTPQR